MKNKILTLDTELIKKYRYNGKIIIPLNVGLPIIDKILSDNINGIILYPKNTTIIDYQGNKSFSIYDVKVSGYTIENGFVSIY